MLLFLCLLGVFYGIWDLLACHWVIGGNKHCHWIICKPLPSCIPTDFKSSRKSTCNWYIPMGLMLKRLLCQHTAKWPCLISFVSWAKSKHRPVYCTNILQRLSLSTLLAATSSLPCSAAFGRECICCRRGNIDFHLAPQPMRHNGLFE